MGKKYLYGSFAAGILGLILLAGCTRYVNPISPEMTGNGTSGTVYTPAQATNLLSSNLYNWYSSQSGNVFFSPFSIITAMAMAQEGANGQTQSQMQTVLNLNPNATVRLQGFQQLIAEINSPSKPYTISTADNLWPQQGFPILPSYINVLQTYYAAGVTSVDFIGNPGGAVQTIDGAVSQETAGYIPNLLTPSDVNSNTRLVLTNAIYFQADWLSQFQTINTISQTFTLPSGNTESVSMMQQTLFLSLGSFNGAASVVSIPYKGNEAAMYIFLPPPGGMSTLEAAMSGPAINNWLAANSAATTGTNMINTNVALSLPRFEFSTHYDLTTTLDQMGMPLAFTPSAADFSGIDGNKDLYISKVVHQAYIDVTESGTTAAAATGGVMGTTAVPPPPVPFTADHPFIFMIVENNTNTILFMGRVNDPLAMN
jgi:serpin B